MDRPQIKILVIDDEKMNVDLLETFLPTVGYDVTGITDSREALELITHTHFDIVLTDLVMPEVDGMEVVRQVVKQNRDTKILIFTAYASLDTAVEALKQGVYDYIHKPFTLDIIRAALNRAADNLILTRENAALNQKVQIMLSEMTMLHEISSLLYQMPETDFALDMILDTLTEGMQISAVALCNYNKETNNYQVFRSKGISKQFSSSFNFKIGDQLNGITITPDEPVLLEDLPNGIFLNDQLMESADSLETCFLIPLKFRDDPVGFLSVFSLRRGYLETVEQIQLLRVLATQIAPVLAFLNDRPILPSTSPVLAAGLAGFDSQAEPLINPILFRLVPLHSVDDQFDLNRQLSLLKEDIAQAFDGPIDVVWEGIDTLLAAVPGENPINLEISCATLRRNVENVTKTPDGPGITLKYIVHYGPVTSRQTRQALDGMGTRLFKEMWIPCHFSSK